MGRTRWILILCAWTIVGLLFTVQEVVVAEVHGACALLQPCSHSRGTIPDYTSTTSHSVVLDYLPLPSL